MRRNKIDIFGTITSFVVAIARMLHARDYPNSLETWVGYFLVHFFAVWIVAFVSVATIQTYSKFWLQDESENIPGPDILLFSVFMTMNIASIFMILATGARGYSSFDDE